MVREDVLSYGLIGASYLISSTTARELKKIKSVILFGSVAGGTEQKGSDIDLFFDVDGSKKFQTGLRAKLNKTAEGFSLSNAALLFKAKSIDNEFSIKVGKLDEWADLARSIASTGITLYGKYTKQPAGLKAYTIFSWEKPGKAKGALLNKIYGYKAVNKRYPGLLKKHGGTKLGPATIMVPSSSRDLFSDIFKKYKVNYSRYDVWG